MKEYKATTKKNCERYQKSTRRSLPKEEKEEKQQYGRERYKNLPENEKQKLVEYREKYYKMRKNGLL